MSFGVQSNILHSFSNVSTVIPLSCFKLFIVRGFKLYLEINVYVVIFFSFIVSHNGLYDTISLPLFKFIMN